MSKSPNPFYKKSGLKPPARPEIYQSAKTIQDVTINGYWRYVYPDQPADPTLDARYKRDPQGNVIKDVNGNSIIGQKRDTLDGDGTYYKMMWTSNGIPGNSGDTILNSPQRKKVEETERCRTQNQT